MDFLQPALGRLEALTMWSLSNQKHDQNTRIAEVAMALVAEVEVVAIHRWLLQQRIGQRWETTRAPIWSLANGKVGRAANGPPD
jgi:hypothetical protein